MTATIDETRVQAARPEQETRAQAVRPAPETLTAAELATARILLVDDDDLVTSSLASFFALEFDADPIVFNSSRGAAEYVRENDIDLIITDFLMPEMNGIELLRQVRQYQPHVPRVLLTGYADKENAIRAINEVGVYRYVEKPWENDHLRQVVIVGLTRLKTLRALSETMKKLEAEDQDFVVLREALVQTVK